MADDSVRMAAELGAGVARCGGAALAERFLAGSDAIAAVPEADRPRALAQWLRAAAQVLDEDADEDTRGVLFRGWGAGCAEATGHKRDALEKFHTCGSLEAYISAEPMLEWVDGVLHQTWWPPAHGLRCYCGMWRALPADEQVGRTWCRCSAALVAHTWEAILGRPVEVECVESAISGGSCCRFAIRPGPGGSG